MLQPWVRFVGRVVDPIVLGVLCWLIGSSVLAQSPPADAFTPGHLIAAQDLMIYADFDGLDRHAASWSKTAAFQILSGTTTGAMLEEVIQQLIPKTFADALSPAEKILVLKHLAKSGFTFGINVKEETENKTSGATVLVVKKAFSNKEARPLFARLLQTMSKSGTKPQTVVKSGHKMVTGADEKNIKYAWWVEETKKEDLIVVIGPAGCDDFVLEVLEGKKPSVLTHPSLKTLTEEKLGFERTGLLLVEPIISRKAQKNPLEQAGLERIDFQGGFQGEALATLTRFHSQKQNQMKSPTNTSFEKQTIPSIPAGVLGMMVLGFDPKAIIAAMDQYPGSGMYRFHDSLKTLVKDKTKLRFDEDIFTQLGPKITGYMMPTKSGTSSSPAVVNMIGSMIKASTTGGGDMIPRAALLVDVKDSVKFGNSLDEAMVTVNRVLKGFYAQQGEPRDETPPPGGRERMRGPGGPGGPGGRGGPTPEFRVMAGETKSYVFTVPPELSANFPANFRPTIRLGLKQLAIAFSADIARQALEAKGIYVPPTEIKSVFDQLPAKLNWLLIVDPRDSTPEILAALPGKLQAGINIMRTSGSSAVAPANLAASPEGQAPKFNKNMMMGGEATASRPVTPSTAGGTVSTNSSAIVLQVDDNKLPAADAIRRLLFPAVYSVNQDGNAIRFSTREAFPPIPDPSLVGLLGKMIQARQVPQPPKAKEITDGFFDVPAATPASKPNSPSAPGTKSLRVNQ